MKHMEHTSSEIDLFPIIEEAGERTGVLFDRFYIDATTAREARAIDQERPRLRGYHAWFTKYVGLGSMTKSVLRNIEVADMIVVAVCTHGDKCRGPRRKVIIEVGAEAPAAIDQARTLRSLDQVEVATFLLDQGELGEPENPGAQRFDDNTVRPYQLIPGKMVRHARSWPGINNSGSFDFGATSIDRLLHGG